MCGIFGAIQIGSGNLTIASVKEMAVGQERRGPHAFGVAWIDADNRVHHFKSDGKISQNLSIFDRMLGAKAIIGHTRWATHGDPSDNVNNHPHPADGGWYVHNGQIPNHEDLTDEFDLLRSTDCDSEVLGLLMQHLDGTLKNRVADSVNLCDTSMPLNLAGIWSRPARCVVVKRGNPLVMGKGSTGNIYFASLKQGVPGNILSATEVPDNTMWTFDLASKTMTEDMDSLWPCEKQKGVKIVGSTSFDEDNDNDETPTKHNVTFEWASTEAEDEAEAEKAAMDEELEQFSKARKKLNPQRQAALDALNARTLGSEFDGTKYVNGRRIRQIKVDKEEVARLKAAKKKRKKSRKKERQLARKKN